MFFTEGKNTKGPSFGSYSLGAGVDVNFNRYIGVEGEVSGALGVTQDLQLSGGPLNAKTPDMMNYSGNLVVSAANRQVGRAVRHGRRRRSERIRESRPRHQQTPRRSSRATSAAA